MANFEPYGGDAGERISQALLGFGATILSLRSAYDNLQFQRQKEERDYDLAKRGLALREETARAQAENAELRANVATERLQLQQTQFAGQMTRAGFLPTEEGGWQPAPLGALPLTQRAEIEHQRTLTAKVLQDRLLAEQNQTERAKHFATTDFTTLTTLRFNMLKAIQEVGAEIARWEARGSEYNTQAAEARQRKQTYETVLNEANKWAASGPAAAPSTPGVGDQPPTGQSAGETVPTPTVTPITGPGGQPPPTTFPLLSSDTKPEEIIDAAARILLATGRMDAVLNWVKENMEAQGRKISAVPNTFLRDVQMRARELR